MNGRAWTHRELAALRALYPKLKSVAIAARLGLRANSIGSAVARTQQQVAQIRKRLGLPATRGRKPARGQKSPGLQTAGQSLILPEIVVSKI